MPFLRKSSKRPATLAPTPPVPPNPLQSDRSTATHHNLTTARLLTLPGEVRNTIYSLTSFPSLSHLVLVSPAALHRAPIFRVCTHMRAEALSYLCASKELRILGVDVACAVLRSCRDAGVLGHVRRIVLSTPEMVSKCVGDEFVTLLGQATGVRYFKLRIGKAAMPFAYDEGSMPESTRAFLERVGEVVGRWGRDGLVFEWCAGAYDPRAVAHGSAGERAGMIRMVLGKENEVALVGEGGEGDGPMMW